VFETIRRDIDAENEEEKKQMLMSMQKSYNAGENKQLREDMDSMKRMLQLYSFGPAFNSILEEQYTQIQAG